MSNPGPNKSALVAAVVLGMVSACATEQPAVVDYLDESTAVTITRSRTPFVLSTGTSSDVARDFVQIGAIEINRMGARRYFLWFGISEVMYAEAERSNPKGFESIVVDVGSEEFQLDVIGWTEKAIGAGEPIYEKLFRTTVDAYYEVSLQQNELLADVNGINFRTTGVTPKKYTPWYRAVAANEDLKEFYRTVTQ